MFRHQYQKSPRARSGRHLATNFLGDGGSLDNAQRIAGHEVIGATALYDRRGDSISLDEIERIRL